MATERAQKRAERSKEAVSTPPVKPPETLFSDWRPWALLLGALLAGLIVYLPACDASWFYDDNDYVILDPRLDHLELYFPNHWGDPPPSLQKPGEPALYLPGYEKPIYAERFLWHLSFAIERRLFGADAKASHVDNLLIHLFCIAMLFFALWRLVGLYRWPSGQATAPGAEGSSDPPPTARFAAHWRLLPGLAALFFAVMPWASEPVCYISARNGSMGAFFSLAGLWCWTWLFGGTKIYARILGVIGALLCAVAAYACKENFIAAPGGYILATAPLIWSGAGKNAQVRLSAFVGVVVALLGVAWLGIHYSDRASGLLAQATVAGWSYFSTVQSPILLMTLFDEVLVRRLGLEGNFPGWPEWACIFSIVINLALIAWSLVRGWKYPAWLGLAWFYLFLLPSNSILPRPDFLAGRNVYLPTVGVAVLLAAGVLAGLSFAKFPEKLRRWGPIAAGVALWIYFAAYTHQWAEAYANPIEVWQQSVRVAPDHAVVRMNLVIEMSKTMNMARPSPELEEFKDHLKKVISSEDSPTMQYHSLRPKQMARSMALQILGEIEQSQQRFAEAAALYGQSWTEIHRLPVWILWTQVCQQGDLISQREMVLGEGLNEWPNEWWPHAERGIQQFDERGRAPITPEIREELSAAERVPNTNVPGLNEIQVKAFQRLAAISDDKQKALILLERMKSLGVAEDKVEQMKQAVLHQ